MCTFKEMSGLHGYLALPTSGRRTEFRPRLPHIGGDLDSSDVLFRASELRNRACVLSRKVMCTLKEMVRTFKESHVYFEGNGAYFQGKSCVL